MVDLGLDQGLFAVYLGLGYFWVLCLRFETLHITENMFKT
jgi:hypothetical protein